jgi:hypothetical protein
MDLDRGEVIVKRGRGLRLFGFWVKCRVPFSLPPFSTEEHYHATMIFFFVFFCFFESIDFTATDDSRSSSVLETTTIFLSFVFIINYIVLQLVDVVIENIIYQLSNITV